MTPLAFFNNINLYLPVIQAAIVWNKRDFLVKNGFSNLLSYFFCDNSILFLKILKNKILKTDKIIYF